MKHLKELDDIIKHFFKGTVTGDEVSLATFAADKIANESWRKYHSWERHIVSMCWFILAKASYDKLTEDYKFVYFWAALFHDIVYEIGSPAGENEKLSADLWKEKATEAGISNSIINYVYDIICATYGHESTDPVIKNFLEFDLHGFTRGIAGALADEKLIRKEYSAVDWKKYKDGRTAFLKKFVENETIKGMGMGVRDTILAESEILKEETMRIAIFPGTFNPFTIGHFSTFMKAERMFDKVIIVYAENPDKPWTPENVKIPKILKHTAQVEVVKGSLVKWIEALPYPVTIIRGLRNSTDLQYEQNYIAWLQALATKPLDFVFIPSDKDVEHISSSAVRTLIKVDPLKAKDYYYE